MIEIEKKRPVMLTGATGYVAGWIVKKLLDEGLTVHAPVRDPENQEKLKYLKELAINAAGEIKFFQADLLDKGSYDKAMKDCQIVFHTASPFFTNVKDPQKELVDPALEGTRNVLESANRIETVKRVVLTSSCAALYGDNVDCFNKPSGILTEEDWNSSSSLSHNPYQFSKTVAEKEAWEMAKEQERWDLVVINPSLVAGPGINPKGSSESFSIVKQMGDGTMKMGLPILGLGVIDVRDLAEAHFKAGFMPTAKGRYIISAHNSSILEMAKALLEKYGKKYPIPRQTVPKFLVWLFGPFQGYSRKFVSRNVGYLIKLDNSKGKTEFGINYRPLEETMNDFLQQMIDSGLLKKR